MIKIHKTSKSTQTQRPLLQRFQLWIVDTKLSATYGSPIRKAFDRGDARAESALHVIIVWMLPIPEYLYDTQSITVHWQRLMVYKLSIDR